MDQNLTCMICRQWFVYTERERQFLDALYKEGKIDSVIPPKRCKPCRSKKPRGPVSPPEAPRQPQEELEGIQDPEERRDVAAEVKSAIEVPLPAAPARDPERLRFLLVGSDFEDLVCRREVELRGHNGQVVTVKLADIGLQSMKEAMEKAVLAWWRS